MMNWREKPFGDDLTLEEFWKLSYGDQKEAKVRLSMSFIELMCKLETETEEELKIALKVFQKMKSDHYPNRNKIFIGKPSLLISDYGDEVVKAINELLKKFK